MLFFLLSCGGGPNPDLEAQKAIPSDQKIGNLKSEIISGSNGLIFSPGGKLTGTGVIRFADLFPKVESAHNFFLRFEIEDGGSLTLITNANRNLNNGIEIEFSRSLGKNELTVTAKTPSDLLDLSSFFNVSNVSGLLAFSLDLHNDHSNSVHLIIWDELNSGKELLEDLLNGNGMGVHWGLELNQAKVTFADRSKAKDQH